MRQVGEEDCHKFYWARRVLHGNRHSLGKTLQGNLFLRRGRQATFGRLFSQGKMVTNKSSSISNSYWTARSAEASVTLQTENNLSHWRTSRQIQGDPFLSSLFFFLILGVISLFPPSDPLFLHPWFAAVGGTTSLIILKLGKLMINWCVCVCAHIVTTERERREEGTTLWPRPLIARSSRSHRETLHRTRAIRKEEHCNI